MKPTTITIPATRVRIDAAGIVELAELARFIVARLTDEGALDDVAEHAHEAMAVSAAVEWARARLEAPVESVLEPGETLEQLDRTGELDRAAGLEDVSR